MNVEILELRVILFYRIYTERLAERLEKYSEYCIDLISDMSWLKPVLASQSFTKTDQKSHINF